MEVSIIIPNLNSPIISQTIQSLKSQDFLGEFEIIIVGQDRFHQIYEDHQINFIRTPDPVSPAKARNIGIEESRGDIIVFIDSDCVPETDWLNRLISHFESSEINVVGGGVDFPSTNYWTLCDNLATFYEYLSTSPEGFRDQLPSLNLSLRREVIESIGYFDERYPLPAGEDADWTTRMRIHGYKLHFDPAAKIIHLPVRRNFWSILRHAFNFGRYSIKVDKRYKEFIKPSKLLSNWWSVLFFSPLLACGVILKMLSNKSILLKFYTLPVIYFAKLFWCFGASKTLFKGTSFL